MQTIGIFIFVCVCLPEAVAPRTFEKCLGMCGEGGVIDRPDAINLSPIPTIRYSKNFWEKSTSPSLPPCLCDLCVRTRRFFCPIQEINPGRETAPFRSLRSLEVGSLAGVFVGNYNESFLSAGKNGRLPPSRNIIMKRRPTPLPNLGINLFLPEAEYEFRARPCVNHIYFLFSLHQLEPGEHKSPRLHRITVSSP